MTKSLVILASLALIAPSFAHAQVKTTVADTLRAPDGTLPSGAITIIAPSTFTASDGTVVSGGSPITVTVTSGAFTVALIPNAGSSPTGTYYAVSYALTNAPRRPEVWVIPATGPVNLASVRTSPAPSLGTQWPVAQVNPPSPCAAPSNYLTWSVTSWLCASGSVPQLTTRGDLLTLNAALALSRLALGTNLQCLTSNGSDPVWGTCGVGSVTSVALTTPAEFTVTGSPITTSGTFAIAKANQNANLFYSGPSSGVAAAPTFRALAGVDLPVPSATTLGGVKSLGVVASQWINTISTSGVPSATQPACADLSNSGNGCSNANQNGNLFLAGPSSGGAAAPSFRALASADLPVPGLTSRAVTATTDTILAADNDQTVEYEGTAAVAVTLPTPTTLAVPKFFTLTANATTGPGGALTVTPTTWTINGAASLVQSIGQTCRLSVDPGVATNWLARCSETALVAGTGITLTRAASGVTVAANGSGTVTSVALAAPAEFTVSGSPVTASGTLTFAKANQNANLVYSGPSSGAAAAPTFRALAGADLPNPSATTLGGTESLAAVTSKWINTISTSGVPSATQPAFTDISGVATTAQVPSAYQTVQYPAGTNLTQRNTLVARDSLKASDDSTNTRTPLDWYPMDTSIAYIYDDFYGNFIGMAAGGMTWGTNIVGSGGFGFSSGTFPNLGILQLLTGITASSTYALTGGDSSNLANMVLGALGSNINWEMKWRFQLGQTGLGTKFYAGATGPAAFPIFPPPDWFGVRYDTSLADTNFMFVSSKASTVATVSFGVAADTAFHTLWLRSTTAGTIIARLDAGADKTISSAANVPLVNMSPFAEISNTATTNNDAVNLDLFMFYARGLSR